MKQVHDKGGNRTCHLRRSKKRGDGAVTKLQSKKVHDRGVFNKIGRREVQFSVHDVALLTGLLATGKHITFDEGQGACEVEEVGKAAMDDHLTRERASYNWSPSGVELPSGSNKGNKGEDPGEEKFTNVWFYEHTNLYAHANEKCVPHIASWVNLYIGREYDAGQLISSIKDNQIVPVLEVWELERREAIVKAFNETDDFNAYKEDAQDEGGTADSERGTEARERGTWCDEKGARTSEGIAYGQGRGDSVPRGMHVEGIELAHGVKGSADAIDTRITTSEGDNSHVLCINLHDVDVARAEDLEDCEPFGDDMSHEGGNEMDNSAYAREGNIVPKLEFDIQLAIDVSKEGEMHDAGEWSKSSIAKRIRRSPRQRQPAVKQISSYVNPGKRRMGNVYMSRKRSRKATIHRSEQQHEEEIGGSKLKAENVTTTGVVVVPVAAECSEDQELMGLHCKKGQGEEEDAGKADIGTEATTAIENTTTVEVGEAPIRQGGIENISALVGVSHSNDEPCTVGDSDNMLTDDTRNPPICDVWVRPSQGQDEDVIPMLGALNIGVECTTVCEGESALTVDGRGCSISQVRCIRFPVCLYSMMI
ncbi:hypothetical protein Cgig2_030303 [Carnegiea gigantea]|uniref:Uncharacterized protein n=1 Tax=Carnegiea gigantea TaxID=171969 RepID=A0A9Q1GJJ0_9CARY|nr:hypothetical protein Cgig2_030303 [Carnegiea gigantea]